MSLVGREVMSQVDAGGTSEIVVPSGSASGSTVRLLGFLISRGGATRSTTNNLLFKDRESDSTLFDLKFGPWTLNASLETEGLTTFPGSGIRFPGGLKFTPTAADDFYSITVFYRA